MEAMDKTNAIYIYQNGVVLGKFTLEFTQTGLTQGIFTINDWVWAAPFEEWQPISKIFSTNLTKASDKCIKGKTQVMPCLYVRPSLKVRKKDNLSRTMPLKLMRK